jgi:RNA polymerase sigma-70 factor (ECF subfamily)
VKKLQGEWQAVEVHTKGKTLGKDDAEIKLIRFVIKDNEMSLLSPKDDGKDRKKTFQLDPKKSPKEMDLTSLDGQEKGQTAACIYKLEKDKLTLCIPYFVKDPTIRPKEFKAGEDDGIMVLVLERVKGK